LSSSARSAAAEPRAGSGARLSLCYPCLRADLLPMSPAAPPDGWSRGLHQVADQPSDLAAPHLEHIAEVIRETRQNLTMVARTEASLYASTVFLFSPMGARLTSCGLAPS
jgi:hypothetical protein